MKNALHIIWTMTAILTCAVGAGAAGPWADVDKVFGQSGKDLPGEVHRYSWPRRDLQVREGDLVLAPALALGSWAGFKRTSGDHVMAMGDLVLLAAEVDPVIRALQARDLEVLAIHNHLVGETPEIVYVHFAGHGPAESVASALKSALEATQTPMGASSAPPPEPSADEKAALDTVQASLGRKGTMAGKVLQVGVPRASKIVDGEAPDGQEVPASMGMANSMNFQVVGAKVATTGDFVLTAGEVNPVIRELEGHGIRVTALHSHMLHESPRLFFMHFWAVDEPAKVGEGLRAALGKVAVLEPK